MTAQISAYGRLIADVQARTTSTNKQISFTRMAVTLPCQKAESGEATFWLAITAFGKQAELLARHQKGDLLSVAGNMQISQWTGSDGETQTGYQVIADHVMSARTVRSGGKKVAQGQASNALNMAKEQQQKSDKSGSQSAPGWEIYQTQASEDDVPF